MNSDTVVRGFEMGLLDLLDPDELAAACVADEVMLLMLMADERVHGRLI